MTHLTDEELDALVKRAGDAPLDDKDNCFICYEAVVAIAALRAQLAAANARADRAEAALAAQIEADARIADDYTPEKHSGMTLQAHVTGRNIASAIRNQPHDRAALEPAPHVNETPKCEHDNVNVLTALPAPLAPAEDAITKGETASQMLDRLGVDGAKWAAEFRTTALRLGYSDMDEGWLIGWFCNAIMAGHDRAQSPDAGKMAAPVTPAEAAKVQALVDAGERMTGPLWRLILADENCIKNPCDLPTCECRQKFDRIAGPWFAAIAAWKDGKA